MTKIINAQVSLYPEIKSYQTESTRIALLLKIQESLMKGDIVHGSNFYRLVTSDVEISLSSNGCCEIYGDAKKFYDLIPNFIEISSAMGFLFHWLFFDLENISSSSIRIKSNIIQYLKANNKLNNILLGNGDL